MSFDTSGTNAHTVGMAASEEVSERLARMGLDAREIERKVDSFQHISIVLEDMAPGAAQLLKNGLESLGGAAAIGREPNAGGGGIDVILSADRLTMDNFAKGLAGKNAGLEAAAAGILSCLSAGNRRMTWGSRVMDFDRKTYVMGILNSTPDSFYPSSRKADPQAALAAADGMIKAGADIIDIGGESSRPGSDPVLAEEEIRRVVPLIRGIRARSSVMISVDTRKKEVAERALDAGADIINDISALGEAGGMAGLAAQRGVPVVLMHMRGTPKTMQREPFYSRLMSEILMELRAAAAQALEAGIRRDLLILDPGIGFGKRIEDNLGIIRDLASLKSLGFPVLIGLSRKSFIGEITGRPVEERLIGTVAANTLAVINGADIIRVHDVQEAVQAVAVVDAVRRVRA
jgi:dihydropteroate synthase